MHNAMAGFTKLFRSILTSTVWCLPHSSVRVWVAMLAAMDAEGVVEGSRPGFAHLARVTPEELDTALASFLSADPDSRTKDHEGRKLEEIPGGWRVLNAEAYRRQGQGREGSRAPYYRAWRAKRRAAEIKKPEPEEEP